MALMIKCSRMFSSCISKYNSLNAILRCYHGSIATNCLNRNFPQSCQLLRCLSVSAKLLQKEVTVNFVERDGEVVSIKAKVGETLLDVAKDNDISLEGACEGTLACSTCHLIFEPNIYKSLPEPTEEELDMLDLAFELTDTSRLGCQIIITPEMDNMTLHVPKESFDVRQ